MLTVPAVQPLPISSSATVDVAQPHVGTAAGRGQELHLRIGPHERSVHSVPSLCPYLTTVLVCRGVSHGTKSTNGTVLEPDDTLADAAVYCVVLKRLRCFSFLNHYCRL